MHLTRIVSVTLFSSVTMLCAVVEGATYQDIEGMASYIFVQHPNNPRTYSSGRASTKPTADETSQSVEDALALGNSARDSKPPRYDDAERAYRLASRLNPSDPRSYIGLANILYDQAKFKEAIKFYRQALDLISPDRPKPNGPVVGLMARPQPSSNAVTADWHGYLGNTLLKENQLPEAEAEFRLAIANDSNADKWHALLGYTYLLQRKFPQARNSVETAIRLAPDKAPYKDLLKRISSESAH